MLTRTFIEPDLLEVIETTLSFTRTHREYWYFNTSEWLVSSFGRKDEKPTRPMTEDSITWCKKYHIPNAIPYKQDT